MEVEIQNKHIPNSLIDFTYNPNMDLPKINSQVKKIIATRRVSQLPKYWVTDVERLKGTADSMGVLLNDMLSSFLGKTKEVCLMFEQPLRLQWSTTFKHERLMIE